MSTTPRIEASNIVTKKLPNGLTVIVKQDRSSPIVAVNVWFGVGSVHETEEMLARHELRIADFYKLRRNDRGARMHYANAVLAYPGTPSAEKARIELEKHGWDLTLHSIDPLLAQGNKGTGGGR